MKTRLHGLTVGAFAAAAGVNVETIRFYQRKGLLLAPRKSYGSIRRYGESDVARVKFVKAAQRLGFSLEEVAGLLALEDGTHCAEARLVAEQKLADVRAKLDDLRRIALVLTRLVDRCGASRGTITCPLIAALHDTGDRQVIEGVLPDHGRNSASPRRTARLDTSRSTLHR